MDSAQAGSDRFVEVDAGITLCYRVAGPADGPVVVLVAGLAADLLSWPRAFLDRLIVGGARVLVYDHRDIGRSSNTPDPAPAPWRIAAWRPPATAYDLADLAGDLIGLLDHLDVPRAHLIGMSMGGMVSQTLAARWPDRVASLVSMCSSTGARGVGQPSILSRLMLLRRGSRSGAQFQRRHLRRVRRLASRSAPPDLEAERRYAAAAWARADAPIVAGARKHLSAIQKSADRTTQLSAITAPTMVIHGDRDVMVAPSGAVATAAAIPGARLVTVPGLGHLLAPSRIDQVAALCLEHVRVCVQAGR